MLFLCVLFMQSCSLNGISSTSSCETHSKLRRLCVCVCFTYLYTLQGFMLNAVILRIDITKPKMVYERTSENKRNREREGERDEEPNRKHESINNE